MASENKKRKAKNSFIYDGGEKPDNFRCKRLQYFTKQNRARIKEATAKAAAEVILKTASNY